MLTLRGDSTTPESAIEALTPYGTPEMRGDGVALVRHQRDVEESGETIRLLNWHFAQALPPHHLRVVVFSLTILVSQANDADVMALIELLDVELRAVQLAPVTGA